MGRVLEILLAANNGRIEYPLGERIALPATGEIRLKVSVKYDQWQGYWATPAQTQWQPVGGCLDYSVLSDEVGGEHFTGAFIGLASHDCSGQYCPADFAQFNYTEHSV